MLEKLNGTLSITLIEYKMFYIVAEKWDRIIYKVVIRIFL